MVLPCDQGTMLTMMVIDLRETLSYRLQKHVIQWPARASTYVYRSPVGVYGFIAALHRL